LSDYQFYRLTLTALLFNMNKLLLLLLLLVSSMTQARPDLFSQLGLGNDAAPPSVDEAFIFSAEAASANNITAQWKIAEGNYLYKDKISFTLDAADSVSLKPFTLPMGENKKDEIFGLTEVYLHDIEVALPLTSPMPLKLVSLTAHFQGCSETFNICYPPSSKTVQLTLPETTSTVADITQNNNMAPSVLSEQDQLAQTLATENLITILLSFLGLGILLAFTPCVFPMIPILSSIIIGEGTSITTRRAFILSLTYVLAMSVTYTIAGVVMGLLGANLQVMMQNPWVISSFSLLFVALALSMFGLYELQLPQFIQSRVTQMGQTQQGGSLVGVALMGLLSALIVGPCLAPPLAGALIFIGQQGDPLLGGAALFALSFGMGLPLLAIGTSGGKFLPNAGSWMETIKAIFGVLLIALAIWMLERIIPSWVSLWLWSFLFIIVAIFLGAFTTIYNDATELQKLYKAIGLIFFIFGTLLMVGAASGGQTVWQPLKGIQSANAMTTSQQHLNFKRVNNLAELNAILATSDKPVLLDFYADWCIDCKKMEQTTFRDAALIARLNGWQPLQVDVTDNNDEHQILSKQFRVFGPPTILFFDANGQEQKAYRLVGDVSAAELTAHIDKLPIY
jgi:thiol:disulfide interchange protein DsbD